MAVRPLPPALQKIARDELNEVPEDVKKNIEYLRDWINKHPHVKCGTGTYGINPLLIVV